MKEQTHIPGSAGASEESAKAVKERNTEKESRRFESDGEEERGEIQRER